MIAVEDKRSRRRRDTPCAYLCTIWCERERLEKERKVVLMHVDDLNIGIAEILIVFCYHIAYFEKNIDIISTLC